VTNVTQLHYADPAWRLAFQISTFLPLLGIYINTRYDSLAKLLKIGRDSKESLSRDEQNEHTHFHELMIASLGLFNDVSSTGSLKRHLPSNIV
jgi:hypothetical protein